MTPVDDAKKSDLVKNDAVAKGPVYSPSQISMVNLLPENYRPRNNFNLPLEMMSAIRNLPCDAITQSTMDEVGDYDFACSTDSEERISYILSATEDGRIKQITLMWIEYPVGHMYDDMVKGKLLPFLSYIDKRFLVDAADSTAVRKNLIKEDKFRLSANYFIVDYNYEIKENSVETYKINTMTYHVR
jgi:hypothetical protein